MPVTKTAKRALRSSKRKEAVNRRIRSRLEIALRTAKKERTKKKVLQAQSLVDRAAKKHLIHKKRAARIKSGLSQLLVNQKPTKSGAKKPSKAKSKK